jgi:oxygen-independent coproporphyrinogen-3 oxidase
VRRADLPFEYMLNALRLRSGFALQDFMERTGLPSPPSQAPLEEAEQGPDHATWAASSPPSAALTS